MTSPRQLAYLNAMGIPVWVTRDHHVSLSESKEHPCADSASSIINALEQQAVNPHHSSGVASAASPKDSAKQDTSRLSPQNLSVMDWQVLQQTVSVCQLCDLHKTRSNTVFGNGNPQASWMVIGEAPGAEEDRQGLPFVGRAGQLLTNMLLAIGLNRQDAFIANVLKCRPPNNRDPLAQESESCKPYLDRQIELINPKIILVVGRVAAQNLLQSKEPLARLRGKVHRLPNTDIPVLVTYHPAYLLRKPDDKRKAWDDLKLASRIFSKE